MIRTGQPRFDNLLDIFFNKRLTDGTTFPPSITQALHPTLFGHQPYLIRRDTCKTNFYILLHMIGCMRDRSLYTRCTQGNHGLQLVIIGKSYIIVKNLSNPHTPKFTLMSPKTSFFGCNSLFANLLFFVGLHEGRVHPKLPDVAPHHDNH